MSTSLDDRYTLLLSLAECYLE